MIRKGLLNKIKLLDLYPKTTDEIKVRTPVGATVTILGSFLLLFLALSEFQEYVIPSKKHTLTVNYNRDEKMKIMFRLLFTELPCEAVNIDVTDRFGGDDIAVETKSFQKLPWKGNFPAIKKEVDSGSAIWLKTWNYEDALWSRLGNRANVDVPGRAGCMPCYEATGRGGIRCCNSCLTLKRAYIQAGISEQMALQHPQCISEGGEEGCMMYGYIEVNKVQGNFHVAVGESHLEAGKKHHHHWPANERRLGFNTTHYISQLSFGDNFPNMKNPLDGFYFVENGIGQQQYFLQVVPTTFENEYGELVETNQYSVTYHHSEVDLKSDHIELPGVFFKYDISEVKIFIKEESQSFSRFITRLCAVIGGVWVVIGLIYSLINGCISMVAGKLD